MSLAAVLQIIAIANAAISTARDLIAVARRNGELTPEQEKQLSDAIQALQSEATKPAHWRID